MPENGEFKTLEEHSIEVAKHARNLCGSSDKATQHAAYCAGLMHDLGKLSPSYQKLFCAKLKQPDLGAYDLEAKKSQLEHRYGRRQHSIFSCMLAWCLLYGTNPYHDTTAHIVRAILCHHGRLKNGLGGLGARDAEFVESQKVTAKNWGIFQTRARARKEFPSWLDWEKANRSFEGRRDIGNYGNPGHTIAEYLRGRIVFSALVQGDYLSFPTNKEQTQNRMFGAWMRIDPKKAHGKHTDPSSPINALREKFQNDSIFKYDTDKCVDKRTTIIEAPTGIGKTALLLHIMSKHANESGLARCYYFSPLIALNSSFVDLVKDKNVMPAEVHKFVLTYNYAFKKTLNSDDGETDSDDDLEESDYGKYNFAYEAFQYPLVITTTQRLLLTLYANHKASVMKLASLSKSLMIIDEIQTIPRFMRQITMDLLDRLCEECGSRVVLASATVPTELKKFHTVGMDVDTRQRYLELTSRTICMGKLDTNAVVEAMGLSPLVMFNTRKKAAEFYEKISSTCENTVYLSTGIKRGERLDRINTLVREKQLMETGKWPHKIVVSTQVLEAGVDASFGRIWRELAPMDSIVQAMGRLDRGAELCGRAKITIFSEYDPKHTVPYDSLDVKITYDMLKMLGGKHGEFTSSELYDKLEEYYDLTMDQNKESLEQKEKFEYHVKKQHYEKAWDMVAKTMDSYNIPIIIPSDNKSWHTIHSKLRCIVTPKRATREQKMKSGRIRKNMYMKHSELVAEFPDSKRHKIEHMLDDELLDNGIAFPKKEHVEELYDTDKIGLDRHLLNE